MDDEATRNKLEELRRDQLVEMIASVGFDMPGANGEPPLSRDRIRFAVDLGTMVAKDAAKALENRTNMADEELRTLVVSIALKELEAFAQAGLSQLQRQAEEQLGLPPSEGPCDCYACQINRAAESEGDLADHPLAKELKAMGFEVEGGGDGFAVLRGTAPQGQAALIIEGSVVIAVKDGGHDQFGLPVQRPVIGRQYKVTGTYEMPYGLGCTLENMDPSPYRGYILHKRSKKNPDGIWYFQEIE